MNRNVSIPSDIKKYQYNFSLSFKMNFKITVKTSEAINAIKNIAPIKAPTSPDKKIIFN